MNFKVGDIVVCRSGYLGGDHIARGLPASRDLSYGGFGYVEGKTFKIKEITPDYRSVVWSDDLSGGVFIDAIEPTDPQHYRHHGSKLIFKFI